VLQLKSSAAKTVVSALMDDKSRAFARVAQKLDPLTKEVNLLGRFTEPNKVYAYCFCGAN
jgi:hypothetical protein